MAHRYCFSTALRKGHCREPLGCVLYFGRKVFVFEVWGVNEFEDRIAEKERILAVVKPETHFVKVGREMFRRDFMPRTHNAALEQGKGALNVIEAFVIGRKLLCDTLSFMACASFGGRESLLSPL
jgi:hypothetical protein